MAPIADKVPDDCPGAREIGFAVPARYNASAVLFDNLARRNGDRPALRGPGGTLTYDALCLSANRAGNALASLGLARGDRVVMICDDTPLYPAFLFGAMRAGLVPVLVNTLTPPDLIQFYLADAAARAAVVEADCAGQLTAEAVRDTKLEAVIVANGQAALPHVRRVIEATPWLAEFSDRLDPADTHRDDMAFWMYSSGSTGRPKGIVHLQHDMAYTALSYGRHILKLTSEDICYSAPKIFFSYGFSNSITYPFSVGATSLLVPGAPKPAAVFAAIAQYRPTVFFGLPTLYVTLTNAPEGAHADVSSLRLAISAAEILSADVFNAWKELTGLEIIEGLGSTEVQNIYVS